MGPTWFRRGLQSVVVHTEGSSFLVNPLENFKRKRYNVRTSSLIADLRHSSLPVGCVGVKANGDVTHTGSGLVGLLNESLNLRQLVLQSACAWADAGQDLSS